MVQLRNCAGYEVILVYCCGACHLLELQGAVQGRTTAVVYYLAPGTWQENENENKAKVNTSRYMHCLLHNIGSVCPLRCFGCPYHPTKYTAIAWYLRTA